MLERTTKFKSKKKKGPRNVFDLPIGAQTKIFERVLKDADSQQLELVKKYEKKFGVKVDLSKCNS